MTTQIWTSYLSNEQIDELTNILIDADLSEDASRRALLGALPKQYLASLSNTDKLSDRNQLSQTIRDLSNTSRLQDGTVPLAVFLQECRSSIQDAALSTRIHSLVEHVQGNPAPANTPHWQPASLTGFRLANISSLGKNAGQRLRNSSRRWQIGMGVSAIIAITALAALGYCFSGDSCGGDSNTVRDYVLRLSKAGERAANHRVLLHTARNNAHSQERTTDLDGEAVFRVRVTDGTAYKGHVSRPEKPSPTCSILTFIPKERDTLIHELDVTQLCSNASEEIQAPVFSEQVIETAKSIALRKQQIESHTIAHRVKNAYKRRTTTGPSGREQLATKQPHIFGADSQSRLAQTTQPELASTDTLVQADSAALSADESVETVADYQAQSTTNDRPEAASAELSTVEITTRSPPADNIKIAPWQAAGAPEAASKRIGSLTKLHRPRYTIGFDAAIKLMRWSAYTVNAVQSQTDTTLVDTFRADPMLPPDFQTGAQAYERTPYQPGQAVYPSYSRSSSTDAKANYFSNALPMAPTTAEVTWPKLHQWAQAQSTSVGLVQIFTGPVFYADKTQTNRRYTQGPLKTEIPVELFMVLLRQTDHTGDWRALAFIVPNDGRITDDITEFATSVSAVEKASGLRFFTTLDPAIQGDLKDNTSIEYFLRQP